MNKKKHWTKTFGSAQQCFEGKVMATTVEFLSFTLIFLLDPPTYFFWPKHICFEKQFLHNMHKNTIMFSARYVTENVYELMFIGRSI
jgi:hypothetical protein